MSSAAAGMADDSARIKAVRAGWRRADRRLEAAADPCFASPMTDSTTNPTIALLQTRRSVAPMTMTGPGPTPDEMATILGIAARVPDHGKLAPWRFIVIEGDGRARAGEIIASVFAADNPDAAPARLALERKRLEHAPGVIAVVSRAGPHAKIPEWEQLMSAGAAAMNLVVAANALGFVTAWLTEWYSYDARVGAALGLAGHERLVGFVHIGRPTVAVEDRVRPVMADIVTHF
jgi:nitroreductase